MTLQEFRAAITDDKTPAGAYSETFHGREFRWEFTRKSRNYVGISGETTGGGDPWFVRSMFDDDRDRMSRRTPEEIADWGNEQDDFDYLSDSIAEMEE